MSGSRLPIVSAKTMIDYITYLDFEEIRQKGSHKFFKHKDGKTTVIPFHQGEDIGRGLMKKILRDIEVSNEDFLSWYTHRITKMNSK